MWAKHYVNSGATSAQLGRVNLDQMAALYVDNPGGFGHGVYAAEPDSTVWRLTPAPLSQVDAFTRLDEILAGG